MIDDFVRRVFNSTGLAYRAPSDPEARVNSTLQCYMPYFRAMVDVFNGRVDYDFSVPLELFNDVRLEIGLRAIGPCLTCLAHNEDSCYLQSEAECINFFIQCLREKAQRGGYIRSLSDRAHDASIQSQELKEYVETVMEVCPRTMVVRGNLCYQGAFKSWFRVGDVFAGRCLLINAISSHAAFAGLTGYILGIEQSERWGFYIHAVFFFDAYKVMGEAERVQLIKELWAEITEGRGCWGDTDQDSADWHPGGLYSTTGVFDVAEVSTSSRVAKGMMTISRGSRSLRIKPENGQVLKIGRWPGSHF